MLADLQERRARELRPRRARVGASTSPRSSPACVEGQNLDIGYHRVFGGQILAQVLAAAAAASPDKSVKSLHILFPREGDTAKPMRYTVQKLQDGRTFGTTEVVASQDGKVIAAAIVSMHADEPGLHRTRRAAARASPVPRRAATTSGRWCRGRPRIVGGVDLADRAAGPPTLEWWMRTAAVPGERPTPPGCTRRCWPTPPTSR